MVEQRLHNDGERCHGEDCPPGMVQVEFVGVSPSLKQGEYGWKPVKHAFMDVWVDGKRFHITVGDFHDGVAQRRGLHIVTSLKTKFEQTSLNAVSLYFDAAPAQPRKLTGDQVHAVMDAVWSWRENYGDRDALRAALETIGQEHGHG